MNIHGLKLLSAAACLALAGCMSANNDETAESQAAQANKLKFVNAASASLAKVTAEVPGQVEVDYEAIGCPKLAKFMEDMSTNQDEDLPPSMREFLECFGISGNGTVEDIDAISDKVQNHLNEVLDCICGGTGLSGLLAADGKWEVFSSDMSVAAGESFNASQSSIGGTTYNGSSSVTAGDAYTGSQSNVAGEAFRAE